MTVDEYLTIHRTAAYAEIYRRELKDALNSCQRQEEDLRAKLTVAEKEAQEAAQAAHEALSFIHEVEVGDE